MRHRFIIYFQGEEWLFVENYFISLFIKYLYKIARQQCFASLYTSAWLRNNVRDSLGDTQEYQLIHPIKLPLQFPAINSLHFDESSKRFSLFVLLRNGWVKNLRMYLNVLDLLSSSDSFCQYSKNKPVRIVNLSSQPIKSNSYKFSSVITEGVSRPEFSRLLRYSMFTIYLSSYEGFGLVPLEATVYHCLPILSQTVGVTSYLSDSYPFFLPDNYGPSDVASCVIDQLTLTTVERLNIFKENSTNLELFLSNNKILTRNFLQNLRIFFE